MAKHPCLASVLFTIPGIVSRSVDYAGMASNRDSEKHFGKAAHEPAIFLIIKEAEPFEIVGLGPDIIRMKRVFDPPSLTKFRVFGSNFALILLI